MRNINGSLCMADLIPCSRSKSRVWNFWCGTASCFMMPMKKQCRILTFAFLDVGDMRKFSSATPRRRTLGPTNRCICAIFGPSTPGQAGPANSPSWTSPQRSSGSRIRPRSCIRGKGEGRATLLTSTIKYCIFKYNILHVLIQLIV